MGFDVGGLVGVFLGEEREGELEEGGGGLVCAVYIGFGGEHLLGDGFESLLSLEDFLHD